VRHPGYAAALVAAVSLRALESEVSPNRLYIPRISR
jgi:hypothetical protein